jgi:nicotinamide-nucleotide amidase
MAISSELENAGERRTAALATVGDELICGDVSNTNAAWLGRNLEQLGIAVRIAATLPDDRSRVAQFVRWAAPAHGIVIVTGGLGGTPDDITREAIAEAFGVGRVLDRCLAASLEEAGGYSARFSSEWARLPEGSSVLPGVTGAAPAFSIANVYVLAGVPAEMRSTFMAISSDLERGAPLHMWRSTYATTEDQLASVLQSLDRSYEGVAVGSYPRYGTRRSSVEIVLKGPNNERVSAAARELEAALARAGIRPRSR